MTRRAGTDAVRPLVLLAIVALTVAAGGLLAAPAFGDAPTDDRSAASAAVHASSLDAPTDGPLAAASQAVTDRPPATIRTSTAAAGASDVTYEVTVENVAARDGLSAVDQIALDLTGTGVRFDGLQPADVTLVKNPETAPTPLVVTKTRTSLTGERPTIGVSRASGQPRVSEGDTLRVVVRGLDTPAAGQHTIGVRLNELATGERAGLLDVREGRFATTAETGSFAGILTDDDGEPVTTEATFTAADGTLLGVTTPDADGTYVVEGVPPGSYDVIVSAPGYADATIPGVEVHADEETTGADATLTPEVVESGELDVEVSTNEPVVVGDSLDIDVAITNPGSEPVTEELALTVVEADGDVVATENRSVTVDAGTTANESFGLETGTLDPGEYVLDATVGNASGGTAVSVQRPATFAVRIEEAPSPVQVGETATVPATVENVGDVEGDAPTTLTVRAPGAPDDEATVVDETTVELDAGEETEVALQWPTADADPGVYDLTVATPDDATNTAVTVSSEDAGSVSVTAFDAPDQVVAGDPLSVNGTVYNDGDEEVTRSVAFLVDGDVVDGETLTLDPDESATVAFDWNTTGVEPRDYELTLTSGDDEATRSVTVQSPAAFELEAAETDSPVSGGDPLTVNATVENVGGAAGEETVTLAPAPDAEPVDETTVSLAPGEATDVQLEWETPTDDPGVHEAFLAVDDDDAAVPVQVGGSEGFEVDIDNDTTAGEIEEGTALPVNVTVESVGTGEETQRIGLVAGDMLVDTRSVTLDGGEATSVTLTWPSEEAIPGEHVLEAWTGDDAAAHEVTVRETAVFAAENVTADTPVTQGDTSVVNATVTNVGDSAGETLVVAEADGRVVDTTRLSLEPGESTNASFAWNTTWTEPGTYEVVVTGPDPASTVTEPPAPGVVDVEVTEPAADEEDADSERPDETTDPTETPDEEAVDAPDETVDEADRDCELFGVALGAFGVCWYWWLLAALGAAAALVAVGYRRRFSHG